MLPMLLLVLTLAGCSNEFIANSAGEWAKIELGEAPKLTPEGLTAFNEVSARFPDDAKKIIGRNNELTAKIKEYNERARKHNRELYSSIKMDPKKINLLEP